MMNYGSVVRGGLLGGLVWNIVSIVVNVAFLGSRYAILQSQDVYRTDPRLPFLPIHIVQLFILSIALVWLYAAARQRLGPGPKTALMVGLAVGLIGAGPHGLAEYSWAYTGGFVSLCHSVETVAGCALATLAGAWLYKE